MIHARFPNSNISVTYAYESHQLPKSRLLGFSASVYWFQKLSNVYLFEDGWILYFYNSFLIAAFAKIYN